MTQHSIHNRETLPQEFHILLGDYPREAWPDHPNFAQSIQNWMGAHQMFRQLGDIVTKETEKLLDKSRDPKVFIDHFGYYGNLLVRNLHGHHHWEDHEYFPELSAADPRFDHGLDMLETDHHELDKVLDALTQTGNRTLKLMHLDESQGFEEANKLLEHAYGIERFLKRHLSDEEDLVVPILLHHKMRG